MNFRSLRYGALAGVALAFGVAAFPAQAAEPGTEVVREADVTRQPENTPPTDNWVIYSRTPASTATFRVGPAEAPLGTGSLELTTPTGADKVTAFNYDHVGTDLDAVTAIGYSTYRIAGEAQQVAALNLQVDYNGAALGGFTTLVFEPVYNNSTQPVVSGEWQDWSADGSGRWWSTRTIPGVCASDCFVAWEDILAANPDAVITGGVGINQGSGNRELTTAVDAFTFNATTYDFEGAPITADGCKNGGYAGFGFKNQGECVSYVNKNK